METRILNACNANTYEASVAEAAAALQAGKLVIFPTETVYGLAANAADPAAVARLRDVKGRRQAHPFTVHIGRRSDAARFVSNPSPLARRLARRAWPGPVTLVVEVPAPAETEVGRALQSDLLNDLYHEHTVGLRLPDHSFAQRLLTEAGVPIIASSANPTGEQPPIDVHGALQTLAGKVDIAIDGGRTRYAAASTVVEVSGNAWRVRRAGVYDERTIARLVRSDILFVCTGNSCRSPLAEHLFRKRLAERLGCRVDELSLRGYHISSAGTFAGYGGRASTGTLDELQRRGIDARGHRSQPLTIEMIQQAERIFTMSDEHRAAVLGLVPAAASRTHALDSGGPISDPVGGGPDDYARCARHIEQLINERIEEFVNEDRDWQ